MLTPEKISELKAAHGDKLAVVETPRGDIVFKAPTRAAYDKWIDGKHAGKAASENARELAQHCLVLPTHEEFVAILDALPGILLGECVEACTLFSGLVETYEVKKL
jgi:hypothetical protein